MIVIENLAIPEINTRVSQYLLINTTIEAQTLPLKEMEEILPTWQNHICDKAIFPNINDLASFDVTSNFEGPEYQRTALEKWQDTTLDSTVLNTPEKNLPENFEKMLSFLRDLKLGLAPRYRDEDFFYTKLLQACKKFPACELVCFEPVSTLKGLIADLRASVALKNNTKASQYI
ncbi:hypothetical protein GcM1_238084 [Golovinomyces cichoracearum]|uniref:Uncharacterized protein n=1 Tax=Golovinomyces cichoracearum TaxID=62708 RepID=A0A420IJK2_9PEZI|nr:hypothetical protein GcM1_238084 [Golovinomyces cichoracearum]